MNKKIYFDSQYGMETFAMTENGLLTDFRMEKAAAGAVIGNIYKGRVTDVLNGMQAAFIDCGLERHCYISANEMPSSDKIESAVVTDGEPSPLNLSVGDEVMVQIIKTPQGKKGAKVTTNISFVGKYIVYLPVTPFVGISEKISDAELKKNLLYSAKKQLNEGEGVIVRTAAPYAVLSDKVSEITFFRNLYANIKSRFENAPVGELLYSDSPLHMRVLRDLMLDAGDEIHVGNDCLYSSVTEATSLYRHPSVTLHDAHRDLFYSEGITDQILQTLQSRVELSNGAHIVIDRTEALTVIDVNTGKFTGEDSMEHTAYFTNVLAAHEIARQVKLRNLGGIFVVDFIDMEEENHRKAIVQELEKALKTGGSKCKVLPMSKFGLVEFTRKRTGAITSELLLKPCKVCGGGGVMRSFESILSEFRARLLEILSEGATNVCVDLNFDVANTLMGYDELKANIASLYPQARIYIIFHRTYRESNMYFRKIDGPSFSLPEGTVLMY